MPATAAIDRVVLGGKFGERPLDVCRELLALFADQGGRWVETAHSYAGGRAERALGAALAAGDASAGSLRVITKVGHRDQTGRSTLQPDAVRRQIAVSVERLGRPIDLLMLHRDDEGAPVERLLEPVAEAVRSGLARQAGVSNWSAPRAEAARELLGRTLAAVSLQLSVALPLRPPRPGTRIAGAEDLRWAAERGVALHAWSPLAAGWIPSPSTAPPEAREVFSTPANRELLRRCDLLADRLGCSRGVVALAALLARNEQIRPVLGVERPAELAQAAQAAALAASEARTELGEMLDGRVGSRTGGSARPSARQPGAALRIGASFSTR